MKQFDSRLAESAIALPRYAKRLVVICVDATLGVFALWLAYYLRVGEFIPLAGNALIAAYVGVGLSIPIFMYSGLYRAIFRYSGWPAMLAVAKAVFIYGIFYAAIYTAVSFQDVPRTVGIIQPLLLFILVGATRALARIWLGDRYEKILRHSKAPAVLIYGAGSAGRQLAAAIRNSYEMKVAGFVDDDKKLHGQILNGLKIYNPVDLPGLIDSLQIRDVYLAMPAISRVRRNNILKDIGALHVAVRTLPAVSEIASGKIEVSDLKELDIDDLLSREPVSPNECLLKKSIANKVVLVTGAGGSIGSELCRQVLQAKPRTLLMLDQSEYALYAIHQELSVKVAGIEMNVIPLLGSVVNENRIREVMGTWSIDTVYHAAAYKHVPLVEHNPVEGIRNNVFGTLTLANLASEYEVKDFVLISTDKAVRPTNVMGASKRLAEMVLQALALETETTNFTMVRFGNVLGSSGSVVPRFREQIKNGGPVSLTHQDVTRYFMSIPEAAQLVLQAGAMSQGGDVFVLDMGEPVKILDLARKMIELSGLSIKNDKNPDGDIEIEITGLRAGEKLFEELLIGSNPERTIHPRIMVARERLICWRDLEPRLSELDLALRLNNAFEIREILQKLVQGYEPERMVADYIVLERERKQ